MDFSYGDEIESCCVLTTASNDLIKPIHHRMPVVYQMNMKNNGLRDL